MDVLLFDNAALTPKDRDYCCEPKTGGFANELLHLGNEVTMFGQKVKSEDNIHTYKLQQNGIAVVGLKRKNNKIINYFLLYLRAIPEIVKSDFVYIFYPNAFRYIAFLCILFRKKYGLYIRGQERLRDNTSHLLYKKAFVIFTVSDLFTDYVNNVSKRNIANTIRPMMPYTEKDIVKDRKYQIKDRYNILFLGRVAFDKGVEELLHAIKILHDKKHSIELTIVGNGEFIEEAKKISSKLRITSIVNFAGAHYDVDIIREFYINSCIYILPTYHEGFPRTLYEAMIFKTPIITTLVGGIPALMEDRHNCLEIKPKSIESIVEVLEYAINNYSKMIEYANNGAITVQKIVDSNRITHAEHLNEIIS